MRSLVSEHKPGGATLKTRQPKSAKMPESLKSVLSKCYDEYVNNTPKKLKIVDAYLTYIMLTGIMQFVYCCLVGTFPFNSFLSGFISCIGSFVLGGMFFLFIMWLKFRYKTRCEKLKPSRNIYDVIDDFPVPGYRCKVFTDPPRFRTLPFYRRTFYKFTDAVVTFYRLCNKTVCNFYM